MQGETDGRPATLLGEVRGVAGLCCLNGWAVNGLPVAKRIIGWGWPVRRTPPFRLPAGQGWIIGAQIARWASCNTVGEEPAQEGRQ